MVQLHAVNGEKRYTLPFQQKEKAKVIFAEIYQDVNIRQFSQLTQTFFFLPFLS